MLFGRAFSWGALIAWIAVLGLLTLLAFGLLRTQKGTVAVGENAPDFTLTTFDDQQFHLSDYKGKVVLVNFWASWCKPCEQEAADLEAAWRYYQPRGDVLFLGVDYVDTETEAKAYLDRFDITYPNGPDLATHFPGLPHHRRSETFIIGKDGKLKGYKYALSLPG
jgi:cytochrome c biogenesis protein CcmG/thiol:disulfide interchange protein DsbE